MAGIERVIIVVLDSAGVGALPDAALYGDEGANTLGHIGDAGPLAVPNMEALGLGNIKIGRASCRERVYHPV